MGGSAHPSAPAGCYIGPMRIVRRHVRPAAEPVSFTYDGAQVAALAGETVAAALAASGRAAIRRHERARDGGADWRGLWCGMGACYDCVVTIDGRTGQRACLARVRGGEVVRSQAPAGTPEDPLRPLVPPPAGDLPERVTDVLVVGAGPAGLAAALAAREAGADVTLLDERADPGGQYYKPVARSHAVDRAPDPQFAAGAALARAVAEAGVTIHRGASVYGAFAADEVLAEVDGAAVVFRPRRLVLATGATERAMPVPGWTLPGVMTTGAAQTLARSAQVAPGLRVVIAGNGPLNIQLATDLVAHGVEVAAVAEVARAPAGRVAAALAALAADPRKMAEGARYLAALRRARVPLLWGHAAVAAHGNGRVETVDLAPVAPDGTPDRARIRRIEADALALGYGFVSSLEIAVALGCRTERDGRHLGTLRLVTSNTGETTVSGVFAVGDGARVAGADVAEASGRIAGAEAARQLGLAAPGTRAARLRRRRAERFQKALWTLFEAPPVRLDLVAGETILCRCESIDFATIRGEIDAGAKSLAVLKRRTRLGMGRCQGRTCTPLAARLLADRHGTHPLHPPAFAPRLPVKPFPAAALAVEKPEWGGHRRAGSPNLARPVPEPPFGSDEAEVVVIGGGVVGACVACELASAGRDVLMVERDDVNLQASGSNAGSLHVQLLSFDFGAKAEAGGGPAAATLPLGPWSVRLWEELAEACGRDFEIRITGGLMVAESAEGLAFLKAKAKLERAYGIEAEIIGPNELRNLAPALGENLVGAEYAPQEGKINPLTATYSVMNEALRRGARIRRSTDVVAIERNSAVWEVRTSRGTVRAGIVVNAAGPWARPVGTMVGLDVPVHSAPLQMIVTERAPKLVDQLVAHADRHLSLKQLDSGGLVIGGAWTARYAEAQNLNVTTRPSVEGNLWVASRVLPQLAGLHVLRTWAGMNVNIDGAPIVGEAPGTPGFYNAVTSNGYTLAPAVGRITADLIVRGRTDVDVTPYRLDRFSA